jgi:hypothetical protein
MALLGYNGGLRGKPRIPSTSNASGIWDLDEQKIAASAGIWPGPVAPDPYWANVSLLLHMDGSNNSTTFTDSSANALTVTPSNNAKISTDVVKYGTGAYRSTGATNDQLALPSTSLLQLTGDFTIEFWLYALASRGRLFNLAAANSRIDIDQNGSNPYKFYLYNEGAEIFDNLAVGLSGSSWHHLALTRSGSTLRLFGGGTLYATATHSSTLTPTTVMGSGNSLSLFDGYMDDLRITKGVARYTANFTPPTAPFPNF